MIDIHSHILPMVDDGAYNVEVALNMLEKASDCGTEAIVLTPHFAANRNFINKKEKIEVLFGQFNDIKKHCNIRIKLYPGSEYMMMGEAEFKKDLPHIQTMNNTSYMLIEFPFNVSEEEIYKGTRLVLDSGFIPIIAHPERYHIVNVFPELCSNVIRSGGLFQMNKDSVFGGFGRNAKETALNLLRHRAYAFAGSDAHNSSNRNPDMTQAFSFVADYCNDKYAHMLFSYNPEYMLEDTDIRGLMKHEKY